MKISVAKSAGFCFGMKRALAIALKAAKSGTKVDMLGDIVHNEIVIGQMCGSGIGKIEKLGKGKGRTLLVRAHGAARETFASARGAGYSIIDATCPMVKEIHDIAKGLECDGRTVVIIGDKKHDEVRGIVGQLNRKPVIVSSTADISRRVFGRIKKAGVVIQSTQEEAGALELFRAIKKLVPDTVLMNTVCAPTKTKQREARLLPMVNDIIVVVGSRSSANTKRLYQISKRINKDTYWVNSPDELKRRWFKGASSVGITAGASTPDGSIREVASRVRDLSS